MQALTFRPGVTSAVLARRTTTAAADRRLGGNPYIAAGLVVTAIAVVLGLPFVSRLQADSYKALYDGRWIVAHGLPHTEALTVMARGRSWVDQQWLAEVLLYRAWQFGGDALVALLSLGAVALTYVLLAVTMLRRGLRLRTVVGGATLALLCLSGWQFPRAQDLVLPLFATLLVLCVTDASHARPRARMLTVPPLLVLWANLHGSVLLGVCVACAYALLRTVGLVKIRAWRPALACAALGALALLAPLATPYGTTIVHYYLEFLHNPAMARMAIEWGPARVPSLPFVELCIPLAVSAAVFVRAARRRAWPPAVPTIAVLLTGAAALRESGSIVWFGMTAVLLFAESTVAQERPGLRHLTRAATVAMAAASVLCCALALGRVIGQPESAYESVAPQSVISAVTENAAAHPCARILADNATASALLWRAPTLAGRIAFDARLEQYRPADLARFADFENGSAVEWSRSIRTFSILAGQSSYAPAFARHLGLLGRSWTVRHVGDTLIAVDRSASDDPRACAGRST